MTECQFLKHCPQWIEQFGFKKICSCKEENFEFHYGSCRKYLDMHMPLRTNTKRPREWKKEGIE